MTVLEIEEDGAGLGEEKLAVESEHMELVPYCHCGAPEDHADTAANNRDSYTWCSFEMW